MKCTRASRSLAIVAVISLLCVPGYGDEHKKEEVDQLIKETESRLNTVKNTQDADLVKNEISNIEKHIAASRKLLSSREMDQAFNEISLAILYFAMIDARIDLRNATNELNDAKDKYTQ